MKLRTKIGLWLLRDILDDAKEKFTEIEVKLELIDRKIKYLRPIEEQDN